MCKVIVAEEEWGAAGEWIVVDQEACVEAGEEIAEASEEAVEEWTGVDSEEVAGVVLPWTEGAEEAWDRQARWIWGERHLLWV